MSFGVFLFSIMDYTGCIGCWHLLSVETLKDRLKFMFLSVCTIFFSFQYCTGYQVLFNSVNTVWCTGEPPWRYVYPPHGIDQERYRANWCHVWLYFAPVVHQT
jgi:hypothetical protein